MPKMSSKEASIRVLKNWEDMSFSGRQKTENKLTQFQLPLNRGFHESVSIEISGRQNAHKKLKQKLLGFQNTENELEVAHVPMNRGFFDPPKIAPCVS